MRTENIFPTKGNLINVRKSLQLARMTCWTASATSSSGS